MSLKISGCDYCWTGKEVPHPKLKCPERRIEDLESRLAEREKEIEEQARLLGKSGSREAELLAQLAEKERAIDQLMEALESAAKAVEDQISGRVLHAEGLPEYIRQLKSALQEGDGK